MTVIYHLNAILAVSGLHIMHLLEPQVGLLRTQEVSKSQHVAMDL